MQLNTLQPNKGAVKKRMRVGRGIGSGKGKTCGRGGKGQTARTGVAIKGFEGGQMPLYMRLPKRGFKKYNRTKYVELTLARLQAAIDSKALDAKKPVDAKALVEAGVLRRAKDGVRLIGKGELKAKVDLTVSGATKSAIASVEKAGGKVTVVVPTPAPVVNPRKAQKADKKESAAVPAEKGAKEE